MLLQCRKSAVSFVSAWEMERSTFVEEAVAALVLLEGLFCGTAGGGGGGFLELLFVVFLVRSMTSFEGARGRLLLMTTGFLAAGAEGAVGLKRAASLRCRSRISRSLAERLPFDMTMRQVATGRRTLERDFAISLQRKLYKTKYIDTTNIDYGYIQSSS